MAVKLRLQRTGRKNYTKWRVVAADGRKARDAKCLEILGWYDSHLKEGSEKINLERVDHWLSVGALPSPVVKQIISRSRKAAASAPASAPAPEPTPETEAAPAPAE